MDVNRTATTVYALQVRGTEDLSVFDDRATAHAWAEANLEHDRWFVTDLPVYSAKPATIAERIEYLRGEIRAEAISYGELHELQGYGEAGLIPAGDVEMLEWAGVPEFPDA
jgi:hypothetical protein